MMPEQWGTWKLAHAYPRIGSGTTPTSTNDSYYSDEDGMPWVTTTELRESYIGKTTACVTEEALRDFPALRVYDAGSLMIAMYGATIGRLGITTVPATCNQACCVFEHSEQFDNRFLFYWLWHRRNDLIALSTGGGQPNLSQKDFREERAVCPPFITQQKIARFLDQKCAQIDGLIEKKRALLRRLDEKRRSIITRAVTRGLNPNAPMKSSGIDWLGDIPAHWDIKRLRFLARLVSGSTPTTTVPEYWDGDIPWISPKDVKADELFTSEDKVTSYAVNDYRVRLHNRDNAVIVIRGMILARKVPVAVAKGLYTINQDLKVIESKGEVSPEFFQMYLSSIESFLFTLVAESGHGTKALRTDVLSDVPILVPPKDDQRRIIDELDVHKECNAQAIAKISDSVAKLIEYRAALIDAAVTGQIAELM